MNYFKKVNIFTFLLVVSVFAFVMRLVDVADYSIKHSAAENSPPSRQFEPVAMAQNAPAPASASTAPSAATPAASTPASAAASTTPPPVDQSAAPPPSGDQGFSASELETLQSLAKRRDELDKREQEISQREAVLKAAGVEVDRKIAELTKIKSELEDLLGKQKTAEDERINSLVKIYENMKPKDAANIFNTLEMDVLLPVIAKISERKASPILAAMDPEKARQVTIKLAEQKKLPQLPDDKKPKGAAPASGANAPAAPTPVSAKP